jgi:hypothetical protein
MSSFTESTPVTIGARVSHYYPVTVTNKLDSEQTNGMHLPNSRRAHRRPGAGTSLSRDQAHDASILQGKDRLGPGSGHERTVLSSGTGRDA